MLSPFILLLATALLALPTAAQRAQRRTADSLPAPKLTLPWGTWEGQPYDKDNNTIVFKNISFGKAPVDNLRFAAPRYPEAIEDANQVQNSSYGPSCIQANPKANVTFKPFGNGNEAEGCLFLDVYVPSLAFLLEETEPLPVIVWIYGGAYVFGSKDLKLDLEHGPFHAYDGQGIRDSTIGIESVIWVTGNYRMGAFGFLAGSTMEEQAQPNAGLHDQRLLLDWVQRYIELVRGDKNNVSAWGLSAGAGSILHHLTAYGGRDAEEAPLFQRAAMWSPAYQWGYDRTGALEYTFYNFTTKAKCSYSNALGCLRKAKTEELIRANQEVVSEAIELGVFPFGPAVDGDLVPELPAALLSKGKYNKCSSIIVSHVNDEVSMFLAKWVDTWEDFTRFLANTFPGDEFTGIRQRIELQYPAKLFDFKQNQRMRAVLRDSKFVCNVRQIYNAFHNDSKVYTASFTIPPAQHGFDMYAIIWQAGVPVSDLMKHATPKVHEKLLTYYDTMWHAFAPVYQSRHVTHALTGDPNKNHHPYEPEWEPTVDNGNELTNSMKIGLFPFFEVGSDSQSSTANCAFWDEIATDVSLLLGHGSPPLVSLRTQLELR